MAVLVTRSRTSCRECRLASPRIGGHEHHESSRACDVHAPAFRGMFHQRNCADPWHRTQFRQATHIPGGSEDPACARASLEWQVNHLSDDELVLHYYGEEIGRGG